MLAGVVPSVGFGVRWEVAAEAGPYESPPRMFFGERPTTDDGDQVDAVLLGLGEGAGHRRGAAINQREPGCAHAEITLWMG